MQRGPLHHPLLRVPILLFIAGIIIAEFPAARDLVRRPFSGINTQNLVVRDVDPVGPNVDAGFQPGDVILAVEGQRVRNHRHLRYVASQTPGFQPQEYTVLTGATTLQIVVRYVATPKTIIYRRFAALLVGFTFLLVALLVLVRRDDAIGILFSVNCAAIAFFLTDRPIVSAQWMQLAGELFEDLLVMMFPALFLHFFLTFHDRPLGLPRRRQVRRLLGVYSLPVAFVAVSSFFGVSQFLFSRAPKAAAESLQVIVSAYWLVYLLASLLIFRRNYRASSKAQKQKLRIAILGTAIGIVPFLFMTIWRQFHSGSYGIGDFVSMLALAFISVSFAYAILKHGVIELNIVMRKSLSYAFLTGLVVAGYYAIVNVIGDLIAREFNLRPMYFSMITILVLAVIFAPARDFVQRWIDRLFYRGDYDYKHEVVEFNRELSKKLTPSAILEYFFERVDVLLKPSYSALYTLSPEHDLGLREVHGPHSPEHDLRLREVHGPHPTLPERFPREALLGRYLTRYRKPIMAEYLDYTWGRRNLDEASRVFLDTGEAAVCVPVHTTGTLCALMILGTKLSSQLYNRTDTHLLERFAEHVGLVLENAELHVATIEQERLKHELMLARDIQLRLLPEAPPEHPDLTVLGKMVSSEEVGGDYFDYFLIDSDRIGIAIGDVNGKGVPAAMLMSSLQAVFKNLALRDKMGPADLVGELNRYLCKNAKTDQFATFFYGILNLKSSTFAFCNAGHCPALLIKPEYVDRLGEGGLPLGVDPDREYEEGRVRVVGGDLLSLYTDGVTEQKSAQSDEQFGERRLIEFIQANRNLPLSALQEALFEAVLAYGGGRQDDDVTSIIALHNGA